jgi:hypothetical protein
MRIMRHRVIGRRTGVSDALKNVGQELAREFGIRPLQPGERRPDGYFLVSHLTGKPIIKDRNAVVRKNG